MQRLLIAVVASMILASCTIQSPDNISNTVNGIKQTASGAVTQMTDTVKEVKRRAQNAQKGLAQLESGAVMIQNSLKP